MRRRISQLDISFALAFVCCCDARDVLFHLSVLTTNIVLLLALASGERRQTTPVFSFSVVLGQECHASF